MNLKGFIFILLIFVISGAIRAEAQTEAKENWQITVSQTGGFAGINKSYTLDSEGNLERLVKNRESREKIDDEKVREIGKLIEDLKLPGTKLKTVRGLKIYDGVYSNLTIRLNDREYRVAGTSFADAKYLALSKKQKATLEVLKQKLEELKGFLPDSMNNTRN